MCDFCREAWRKDDSLEVFTARVQRIIDDALWEDRNLWIADLLEGYVGKTELDEDDMESVYDHRFQWFFIKTGIALDLFVDEDEARLWRSLADRHGRVVEWSFDILCAAYWTSSIETPDESHIKAYWSDRQGKTARVIKQVEAGQQSWI